MLIRSKLLVAPLAAAAMMLVFVANASAGRFSFTEREFEILSGSSRPLTITASGNRISCPMTLLGHFNERTFPKVVTQVGVIRHVEPTNGASPPCTGGTMTILRETLPWAVNYDGFTGTLPNIRTLELDLIGVAFRIAASGLGCLIGSTTRNPALGAFSVGTGGRVESFVWEELARIPVQGSFICSLAGEATLAGSAIVTNLPRTATITITLI